MLCQNTILFLFPISLLWLAPRLTDFSSGEIKIYPANTDPSSFDISSNETRQIEYAITMAYIAVFAMMFSHKLTIELFLISLFIFYSLSFISFMWAFQ